MGVATRGEFGAGRGPPGRPLQQSCAALSTQSCDEGARLNNGALADARSPPLLERRRRVSAASRAALPSATAAALTAASRAALPATRNATRYHSPPPAQAAAASQADSPVPASAAPVALAAAA